MPRTDEDSVAIDLSVARAMLRLEEIARILRRPLADFFDPPETEPSRQTEDDPASSSNGEG